MQYSQASQGRVFILRLVNGEIIHAEIEKFARAHSISAAVVVIVGAADAKSKLVVGPVDKNARPVEKLIHTLDATHEITGTGTLFPDETGTPMLHMHLSCGRRDETITGCIREGVVVWQVVEIVLFELLGSCAKRIPDPETGFKLLQP
jgi:predicted DNA-binding protein with PD1-like motif